MAILEYMKRAIITAKSGNCSMVYNGNMALAGVRFMLTEKTRRLRLGMFLKSG